MNVHEGARRMQRAGRWMVLIPVSALLLLVLVTVGIATFHSGTIFPWGILIPACIPLVMLGAILWIAGWIVDGFARDAQKIAH